MKGEWFELTLKRPPFETEKDDDDEDNDPDENVDDADKGVVDDDEDVDADGDVDSVDKGAGGNGISVRLLGNEEAMEESGGVTPNLFPVMTPHMEEKEKGEEEAQHVEWRQRG